MKDHRLLEVSVLLEQRKPLNECHLDICNMPLWEAVS